MTSRSWARAMAAMRSQSGRLPIRDGIIMARVRGVIAASIRSTSMLKVSGSTSTKAGISRFLTRGATVVAKVRTGVTTSAPSGRPSSSTAR